MVNSVSVRDEGVDYKALELVTAQLPRLMHTHLMHTHLTYIHLTIYT